MEKKKSAPHGGQVIRSMKKGAEFNHLPGRGGGKEALPCKEGKGVHQRGGQVSFEDTFKSGKKVKGKLKGPWGRDWAGKKKSYVNSGARAPEAPKRKEFTQSFRKSLTLKRRSLQGTLGEVIFTKSPKGSTKKSYSWPKERGS